MIYNGAVLTEGQDYSVSFSNNVNAGGARATVTGQGAFAGSTVVYYHILRKDLSGAEVTLARTVFDYTGLDIRPDVSSVMLDGASIGGGRYRIYYENNRDVGTGRVAIEGTGNYTGMAYAEFTIRSVRRAAEPDTGEIAEWAPYSTTQLSGGIYHIYLTSDITLSYSYTHFEQFETLYLDLNGHTIMGNPFGIDSGSRLVLLDSAGGGTIQPRNTTDNASAVNVYTGGLFEMYGGTICNYTISDGYDYGTVYVGEGGTFNMYGGTIRDNTMSGIRHGGAVNSYEGTVRICGGEITGNTAYYGGGIYSYRGDVYISGGTISGNHAASEGGGIYFGEGYLSDAFTFEMTGGTITGNSAGQYGGGVYVYYSTFNMSGGTISENTLTGGSYYYGGGIFDTNGVINLSGTAAVVNNYLEPAKNDAYIAGAGICNPMSGKLNISGDARITGNRVGLEGQLYNYAHKGAGIYNNGTMTMTGGTVSGNICRGGDGAGLYNDKGNEYNPCSAAINGGTFSGNAAYNMHPSFTRGGRGGGIWNEGTLTLSGGTISGNTAELSASAIYSASLNLSLSGGVVITGNPSESGNPAIGPVVPKVTGPITGAIVNGSVGDGALKAAKSDGSYELTEQDAEAFLSEDGKPGFLRAWDHCIYVGTEPAYTLTLNNARTADPGAGDSFLAGTEVEIEAVLTEGQILVDWLTTDTERPIEGAEETVNVLIPDRDIEVTARILDDPAIPARVWTGEAYEPEVTVVLNGETLTEETDYTLVYSDNINAGTAEVTITSTAEPVWAVSVPFEILPLEITVTGESAQAEYDGTEKTAGGISAVEGLLEGMTLTGLTWSAEGTDAGTYEGAFEGTALVENASGDDVTENCHITCVNGCLTISPKSIEGADVWVLDENISYTGAPVEPELMVLLDDEELTAGTDYTVRFENNTAAGEADVIVAGTGNYTGEAAGTFAISKSSLRNASLTVAEGPYTYAARELTPEITVMLGDVILEEGVDYTLTWGSNKSAGYTFYKMNDRLYGCRYIDNLLYLVLYNGEEDVINVPEGIEGVAYVFGIYNKMTKVNFPSTIKVIGYEAFKNCSALTSITIPSSIETIGYEAFAGSAIRSITLPANVSYVGEGAFRDCENLAQVIFTVSGQNGVNVIADYAFYNTRIRSLSIAATCTSIGAYAFADNELLTLVNLPADGNLTDVGSYAFRGTGVRSLVIPGTVREIHDHAFSGCGSLASVTLGAGVEEIGYGAFENDYALESAVMESGVTTIGSYAFSSCSALSSVNLPEGLVTIRSYAFSYTHNLRDLTIPDTVTTLEEYAFYHAGLGGSVVLSYGLTSLSDHLFSGSGIRNLVIPESVSRIGTYTFVDCSCLENITLPQGLTSIGTGAFNNCSSLAWLELPSSMTSLSRCLDGCDSAAIVLPDSITYIQGIVFNSVRAVLGSRNNDMLKSLNRFGYTDDPTFIYTYIDDSGLEDYDNLRVVDYIGEDDAATLPGDVKIINQYAFMYCTQLLTLYLPDTGITEVQPDAFHDKLRVICTPGSDTHALLSGGGYAVEVAGYPGLYAIEDGSGNLTEARYLGNAASAVLPDNIVSVQYDTRSEYNEESERYERIYPSFPTTTAYVVSSFDCQTANALINAGYFVTVSGKEAYGYTKKYIYCKENGDFNYREVPVLSWLYNDIADVILPDSEKRIDLYGATIPLETLTLGREVEHFYIHSEQIGEKNALLDGCRIYVDLHSSTILQKGILTFGTQNDPFTLYSTEYPGFVFQYGSDDNYAAWVLKISGYEGNETTVLLDDSIPVDGVMSGAFSPDITVCCNPESDLAHKLTEIEFHLPENPDYVFKGTFNPKLSRSDGTHIFSALIRYLGTERDLTVPVGTELVLMDTENIDCLTLPNGICGIQLINDSNTVICTSLDNMVTLKGLSYDYAGDETPDYTGTDFSGLQGVYSFRPDKDSDFVYRASWGGDAPYPTGGDASDSDYIYITLVGYAGISKDVAVPDGTKSISLDLTGLDSITLPDGVYRIDFENYNNTRICTELKNSITLETLAYDYRSEERPSQSAAQTGTSGVYDFRSNKDSDFIFHACYDSAGMTGYSLMLNLVGYTGTASEINISDLPFFTPMYCDPSALGNAMLVGELRSKNNAMGLTYHDVNNHDYIYGPIYDDFGYMLGVGLVDYTGPDKDLTVPEEVVYIDMNTGNLDSITLPDNLAWINLTGNAKIYAKLESATCERLAYSPNDSMMTPEEVQGFYAYSPVGCPDFTFRTDYGMPCLIGYTGSYDTVTLPGGRMYNINSGAFSQTVERLYLPENLEDLSIAVSVPADKYIVKSLNMLAFFNNSYIFEFYMDEYPDICFVKVPEGGGICFNGYEGSAAIVDLPGFLNGVYGDYLTSEMVYQSEDGTYSFPNCSVSVYPGTRTEEALRNQNVRFLPADRSAFTLPAGLTVIEEEAFSGNAFVELVIPDSVTTIGSRAFANCRKMQIVRMPAGVTFAEDAFAGCSGFTIVTDQWGSLTDWAANHNIPCRVEDGGT